MSYKENNSKDPKTLKSFDAALPVAQEHERRVCDILTMDGDKVEVKSEYYDTAWKSGNFCFEVWNDSPAVGFGGESGIAASKSEYIIYCMVMSEGVWKDEDSLTQAEKEEVYGRYVFPRRRIKQLLTFLNFWKADPKKSKLVSGVRYLKGGNGKRSVMVLVPMDIALGGNKEIMKLFNECLSTLKEKYGDRIYDDNEWDRWFHNNTLKDILSSIPLYHTKYEKK